MFLSIEKQEKEEKKNMECNADFHTTKMFSF